MRKIAASSLIFLLLLSARAEGRDNQLQCRWADLPGRIDGRKIALLLPDGTEIKGQVTRVEPDQLRLEIRGTSNPTVHPKGPATIPAQSISVLRVMAKKRWRILGAIVMPFVYVGIVGGTAGDLPDSGSSQGPFTAGLFGSSVGGYLLGRVLDGKTTEIEVVR